MPSITYASRLTKRLSNALERVTRRLRVAGTSRTAGFGPAMDVHRWLSRIAVKDENRTTFVPVEHVFWIEAANRYIVIHAAAKDYVARETIQSLEEALDPAQFIRIHRGILVRKSVVRGLQPLFHGDYVVTLINGAQLTLSRNFRADFFQQMRY